MLTYLDHKIINRELWDNCINNAPQHLPYGMSWFLDAAAENWGGLVLNNYEAVMPLCWKRKFGIRYIYQPFFTQQLGVFGKAATKQFLDAIPSEFRYIQTNLNYRNRIDECVAEQVNLILDIKSNAHEYYSVHCRRNIRKANRFNLHIKSCAADELIGIFRHTKGKTIAHLKDEHYRRLTSIIHQFQSRNMCEVNGIYDQNNHLLGGAVMVNYKDRSIFFFSALTDTGKEMAGMYYLIHTFIAQSEGRTLDFEGSNNTNLARFYRGFGASEQNYFSYEQNRLPAPLRLLKK